MSDSSNHVNPVLMIGVAVIFTLFVLWSGMVRKGRISGRAILGTGIGLGALMMAVSAAMWWPDYAAGRIPLLVLVINTLFLLPVIVWAIWYSHRQQKPTTIGEYMLEDTKILVLVAPVSAIPDAQGMLLPTLTTLKMNDGIAGQVRYAVGPEIEQELATKGPVGIQKVVQTGGGNSKVGRIFHVAVSDPGRSVDGDKLRRCMDGAAQQARKAGMESLVVPVGLLRGLAFRATVEAIAGGVLRQRRAFAEIVFLVFDVRLGPDVKAAVESAIAAETASPKAGKLSS